MRNLLNLYLLSFRKDVIGYITKKDKTCCGVGKGHVTFTILIHHSNLAREKESLLSD